MHLLRIVAVSLFTLLAFTARADQFVTNRAISASEVRAAEQQWCQALVEISSTYARQGREAATALAGKVIDSAYAYQLGPVLFKPTLTLAPQTFRTTRAGALAYFVGGNPDYPHDTGFALKGWTACSVDNAATFIAGDTATSMGKVRFTDKNGKVTTVDKTWQFIKDDNGHLRIVVHHSSLEYTGQ